MTEKEWEAFMARLHTLPQMGATPKQDTTDFWREIDVLAETKPKDDDQ